MRIVVLIIVAFLLGMFYEKWGQIKYERSCPRVFLDYNCRGSRCDHSWEAWEEIERQYPDKFA